MGSLSNLYISQSFKSLIHLGNDNSASATQVELQDGVGQGLGIYVNTEGDVTIDGALIVSGTFDIEGKIVVNDDVRINGNLEVSGSTKFTGSLVVSNQLTASSAFIQNDLNVGGTLFASKVVTLIESSSIIFSSGSNILGDETSDTQTLIGSVIISGSGALTGSMGISGDLEVKGNISSSTISGIGNVTLYSQSVDARLDILEATASLFIPFSQSVDQQITSLENFTSSTFVNFSQSVDARLDIVEATASLYIPFSTSVDSRLDVVEATASLYIPFSTSVDARLDDLEAFSSSLQTNFATQAELTQTASFLQNQINEKVFTSSFNVYTASVNSNLAAIRQTTASLNTFTQSANIRLTNLESTSASVNVSVASLNTFSQSITNTFNSYTQSTNTTLNTLSSFTGSYATTGSNVFIGNQTITGSLILSSSAAIELAVIGNSTFSGSVRGQVFPITITSNTASMDCSLGNFFTVSLPAGATRLEATNILPGETLSLRITNATSGSQLSGSAAVKFPTGFTYVPTAVSASTDIITFLSFDNSAIYAVAANYFA